MKKYFLIIFCFSSVVFSIFGQTEWYHLNSTTEYVTNTVPLDFQRKFLTSGVDRAHCLLIHSNMLFVGIQDVPPKFIKFPNPLDLSNYQETNLFNDGQHIAARQIIYSQTRGKLLVLFQGSSALTISEIDPVTLATNDVVYNDTRVNDMFSMTTDETNLWVAGFGQGGNEGYDISQYKLSDWSFVGQIMTLTGIPKSGFVYQQWSPIKYDNVTGKIYSINGSNGFAWGFSAPANNMSNFTALVTPVTFDGVGNNIEIIGDHIYTTGTDVGSVENHRIWRMNKSTLAIEKLDILNVAGNSNRVHGLFYDGKYLWISSTTNGTAKSTIQRFNPDNRHLDTIVIPTTDFSFEIARDSYGYVYTVGRALPGEVNRYNFSSILQEPRGRGPARLSIFQVTPEGLIRVPEGGTISNQIELRYEFYATPPLDITINISQQ